MLSFSRLHLLRKEIRIRKCIPVPYCLVVVVVIDYNNNKKSYKNTQENDIQQKSIKRKRFNQGHFDMRCILMIFFSYDHSCRYSLRTYKPLHIMN